MKALKLVYFAPIFKRAEFNAIAKHESIKKISQIIERLHLPSSRFGAISSTKESDIRTIKDYMEKLTEFFEDVHAFHVKELREGYNEVVQVLHRVLDVNELEDKKRAEFLSGGYCTKWKNTFMDGLGKIYSGLTRAFMPGERVKIKQKQFARFVLDKYVGFGRYYEFNSAGSYAIAEKIWDLPADYRSTLISFLSNPEQYTLRKKTNGWYAMGKSKQKLRILYDKNRGKPRLFYLFKVSEHDAYEEHFRTHTPSDFTFQAYQPAS